MNGFLACNVLQSFFYNNEQIAGSWNGMHQLQRKTHTRIRPAFQYTGSCLGT